MEIKGANKKRIGRRGGVNLPMQPGRPGAFFAPHPPGLTHVGIISSPIIILTNWISLLRSAYAFLRWTCSGMAHRRNSTQMRTTLQCTNKWKVQAPLSTPGSKRKREREGGEDRLPAYQLHRDQRQVGGGSLQTLSANRTAEGPEVGTILLILSNGAVIIFTIQFWILKKAPGGRLPDALLNISFPHRMMQQLFRLSLRSPSPSRPSPHIFLHPFIFVRLI